MPIPVTLIGGYLGAGKTTLVNHLLRQRGERRIAVLVNDFGELPIDADLIESRDGTLLQLAGGCVCCSFGSDLMAALQQMLALQPPPQHILIETSGVALPGAVARHARPAAGPAARRGAGAGRCRDAARARGRRYVGELVRQQLQDADLLLLNKTDLVADGALDGTARLAGRRRTAARVLRCRQAQLPPELLLGIGPMDPRPRQPPGAPDAGALFDSLSLEFEHAVDVAALSAMLVAPPLRLLRAKGLMHDRDGQPRSLQLVGARTALGTVSTTRNRSMAGWCASPLRGELQAERICARRWRPAPSDQARWRSTRCTAATSTLWSIGLVR